MEHLVKEAVECNMRVHCISLSPPPFFFKDIRDRKMNFVNNVKEVCKL